MGSTNRCRTKMIAAIALLSIAGVVSTFGAAWICAAAESHGRMRRAKQLMVDYGAARAAGTTVSYLESVPQAWPISVPAGWPAVPDEAIAQHGWGWTSIMATKLAPQPGGWDWTSPMPTQPPTELALAQQPGGPSVAAFQSDMWSTERWTYGLPFRCAELWEREYMQVRTAGVFRASSPRFKSAWMKQQFQTEALPVIPLWPGFALNTLLYAALAWALWQVPLAIRRTRRRRAGNCVRCGYDLKGLAPGSTCPECGAV